jgi:hypothetical protein
MSVVACQVIFTILLTLFSIGAIISGSVCLHSECGINATVVGALLGAGVTGLISVILVLSICLYLGGITLNICACGLDILFGDS